VSLERDSAWKERSAGKQHHSFKLNFFSLSFSIASRSSNDINYRALISFLDDTLQFFETIKQNKTCSATLGNLAMAAIDQLVYNAHHKFTRHHSKVKSGLFDSLHRRVGHIADQGADTAFLTDTIQKIKGLIKRRVKNKE